MFKYKMPLGTQLTPAMIIRLIEEHKPESNRVSRLFQYYDTHNQILNRTMKDSDKPNNKLPHAYAAYISVLATGYFIGEPVTYQQSSQEDQADVFYEKLIDINKYNDEPMHNATLAKYASIAGYSFELLYYDAKKKVRYKAIKPHEIVYVVDSTLEEAPLYAIRYYELKDFDTGKNDTFVEVYSKKDIAYFTKKSDDKELTMVGNPIQHNFNDVPVSIYENNEEGMGDFERVADLIDAYDKAQSDTSNDFEYFTDAYLAFYGTNGLCDEEGNDADMKENRMLFFPETGSSGEWLIKNINDTATENYKNRLDRDIHKFSMVPPMTDENFAGNISGEAMKYKVLGLETLTSFKEQFFRLGLARRHELIANALSFVSKVIDKNSLAFDFTSITPVFTRSLPRNNKELVEMFNALAGDVSLETRLSILSDIVPDPKAEIEKLEAENEGPNPYKDLNAPKKVGEDNEE